MKSPYAMTAIAAGSAVIYGLWAYGWPGLVLAVGLSAAWAWHQFRREKLLLKQASERPAGKIDSVVMMQAHLAHGMEMAEVVALAGCLGHKYGEMNDWQWTDAAGNDIVVSFRRGVVVRWAVAPSESVPNPDPMLSLPEMRQGQDYRAQFSGIVPTAKTA